MVEDLDYDTLYDNTKLVFEDEWLEFREFEKKGKTRKILVWSKCGECYLGEIKWYPHWRHYCFIIELNNIEPMTQALIYSTRCQESILNFNKRLEMEHKQNEQQ